MNICCHIKSTKKQRIIHWVIKAFKRPLILLHKLPKFTAVDPSFFNNETFVCYMPLTLGMPIFNIKSHWTRAADYLKIRVVMKCHNK